MATHNHLVVLAFMVLLALTACTSPPPSTKAPLQPQPPYLDEQGWTVVPVQSDSRVIYVSSSEGSDSNNGLSETSPVKSLERAFDLMRRGYPDQVLLKRGDVWVDESLSGVKSGRSELQPALVSFYGDSGPRPKLKTSGETLFANDLRHLHINGLSLEAYKLNPEDPAFDGKTSANIRLVGNFENIYFEDLKTRFVEFVIQGWKGGMARDIHIRRSIILDKYSPGTSYSRDSRPSGLYTDHSDGLIIEESVWDHNGWNGKVKGASANMFNHNIYLSQKGNVGNHIVLRNNIITRGSALGVHGRPGGLYENNFFARNAIGLQMGYKGGEPLSKGTIAYARNNVVTEGRNMKRGKNPCEPRHGRLCTGAIWGIHLENLGQADVRVENNIVTNRNFDDEGYASGITRVDQALYKNNIVYKWKDGDQGTDNNYIDPGRTVAQYNASLGGEGSFEAFIEAVRNRGLREWDRRYTADAVNDFIRAGFKPKQTVAESEKAAGKDSLSQAAVRDM